MTHTLRERLLAKWRHLPPAVRLALAYALILTLISIVFSLVLYRLADRQLVEGLARQGGRLSERLGITPGEPLPPYLLSLIREELEASRRQLILELIYFNAIVITAGSLVGYVLARRTVRPIEEALEAQSRFAADASHELRTPLAVMRTEIEIARTDPDLPREEALRLLDSNLEEVDKLQSLSEALLRLARSDSQPIPLSSVPTGEAVAAAVARIEGAARAKGIPVEERVKNFRALSDERGLADLLAILLDNAVKYSEPGSKVTISAWRRRQEGFIRIQDEGRGIGADDLPHIFDRFFRADKSRSGGDVQGHGLGLSIARKIAEVIGAEISVESELGRGSSFTVRVPLAGTRG